VLSFLSLSAVIGGERPRQNLQHLRLEVTNHQGGIHLLRRLLAEPAVPDLLVPYGPSSVAAAGFFGPSSLPTKILQEDNSKDSFWITKRRHWQRQQGRSREAGRTGRKKQGGGGGLINSGWRTFVPNVLGRDPRPPLDICRNAAASPRGNYTLYACTASQRQ
jgi:hypothetical protein